MCSNQGLKQYEEDVEDAFKGCIGSKPYTFDMREYVFGGNNEVPEADLKAFLSFDTIPKRPAWSTLRRVDYDRVKRVFAGRGTRICEDTSDADLIKFKESLLLADLDLF